MRLWTLLLLMTQLLLAADTESFVNFFGTSDFALITHQHCSRLIETDTVKYLEEGVCPVGLGKERVPEICDSIVKADSMRSHLIRDIHQKNLPRVLYVFLNQKNSINFVIETLSLAGNRTEWTVPSLKKYIDTGFMLYSNEELEETIFDTVSSVLFLIIKTTTNRRKLHILYLSNMFNDAARLRILNRDFEVKDTQGRYGYVEDPYEHTVYYMTSNSSHFHIFKLPISELLSSLIDGKDGENVSSFPKVENSIGERTLVWARNGAVINHGAKIENNHPVNLYYLRNTTATTHGRGCKVNEVVKPAKKSLRRILGLFDWDYCVLAFGGDGTMDSEGRRCPIYNDEVVDKNPWGTIAWVFIVLLFMTVLVLVVYVCYLRRNLEDSFPRDEHKPVPYYPSGQPLDSTFDISVDRWDQY